MAEITSKIFWIKYRDDILFKIKVKSFNPTCPIEVMMQSCLVLSENLEVLKCRDFNRDLAVNGMLKRIVLNQYHDICGITDSKIIEMVITQRHYAIIRQKEIELYGQLCNT